MKKVEDVVYEQVENGRDVTTISLNELSLMLTILDKERHMCHYWIEEGEENHRYLEAVTALISIFSSKVKEDRVQEFVSVNPHLEHLFTPNEPLPLDV